MKRILVSLIFLITLVSFLSGKVLAQTVLGVSPSRIDLGEIERGKTKVGSLYVISPYDKDILVSLSASEGDIGTFKRIYPEFVENFSEERVAKWLEFAENPVRLEPIPEKIASLRNLAKGWREVNFILKVPEDAEPGWHHVRVRPSPIISPTTKGQIGVGISTVVEISVFFKIPGKAIRSGKIIGIETDRPSGNFLPTKILFKNTGTVSMYVKTTNIKLVKNGKTIKSSQGAISLVRPGKTEELVSYLDISGVEPGYYILFTNVSFTTGKDSYFQTIYIPEVNVTTKPEIILERKERNLWPLILIPIIILLAYLIIKFEL